MAGIALGQKEDNIMLMTSNNLNGENSQIWKFDIRTNNKQIEKVCMRKFWEKKYFSIENT